MEYISVILAAGEGTRMKSEKSKVLHEAAGRPLLGWVLGAVRGVETRKDIVVCGRAIDEIRATYGDGVEYAEQKERLGSGHAVMCARGHLEGFAGYTLIVAGDMPLLRAETIQAMTDFASGEHCDCVLLTAMLDQPAGYGRIIRNKSGNVEAIVEEKDALSEQKEIGEVNASCYCVKNDVLLRCLDRLSPDNAQQEYYLTDIVELINEDGGIVKAFVVEDNAECLGVNDRVQLAEAARILRERINVAHMRGGVTLIDPGSTYIDPDTYIGADTTIYPGVTLEKGCEIGGGCTLYPGSRISAAVVGAGTTVQNSVLLDAKVGENCMVGPNAYLRPGTVIGNNCRIGDFVEVKNSTIGDGTKVSHLTYVGDADLGKNINVGCGVVFVNYDGKRKFRSKIGDDVFIGCNTNLISPVNVGEGAYIAAGTTLTDDMPDDSFAIGRVRQTTKTNWKDKRG